MKNKTFLIIILLHFIFAIYSLTGVFSKLASKENTFSLRFMGFYLVVLVLMGIYAIVWQQIIKRIPLMVAYANKAIVVGWGLLWGVLFFKEQVTLSKIISLIIIAVGIILFATSSDKQEEKDE